MSTPYSTSHRRLNAFLFVGLSTLLVSVSSFQIIQRRLVPRRGSTRVHVEDDLDRVSTEGRITRSQRREDALFAMVPEDAPEIFGTIVPIDEDPLVPCVQTIARAADKRKAEGILALRVSHLTVTTEFFVNMVGNSRPQNQAIAAAIEDDMKETHGRAARHEGTADSGWILLDYGDIIVNVMTPRSRAYYDIESFWKGAVSLDLSDVLLPNLGSVTPPPDSNGEGLWDLEGEKEDAEKDAFWS